MKITAIICEYNPFHKGHNLQLSQVKKDDALVICIMSGGFVERGQPAIFSKYERAKAAVLSGADLVLELPYPFCCSAAEFFSYGGVSLANSLNIVDELCFGSECGDIDKLISVSKKLNSPEFKKHLTDARKDKGNVSVPFAALRERVYRSLYGEEFPVMPNDILGVEYINALSKLKSDIIPTTYRREEGYSATNARRLFLEENSFSDVPENVRCVFEDAEMYQMENAERAILAYYREVGLNDLKKYEGMSNGLAQKIIKGARSSSSYKELVEYLSGKSYTNARIRRAIINGMTGTLPEMLRCRPEITFVLGANENGRKLLKQLVKTADIEILTKPSHCKKLTGRAKQQAIFSQKADSLLTLMCEKPKEADYFLKQRPYIKGEYNHNEN